MTAPSTLSSSTAITASAGPHAAGAVDVIVTNPDGASARLASGFTYAVTVVGLHITGNLSLSSPGDTSQFTATAILADG